MIQDIEPAAKHAYSLGGPITVEPDREAGSAPIGILAQGLNGLRDRQ